MQELLMYKTIQADSFLFDYFELDEVLLDHFNQSNIFETNNLLQKRVSLDIQQNKLGEKLLSVFKSNNSIILNGRSGNDAGVGKFTFRNTSVIDYVIVSPESAQYVQNFQIVDLDPTFSGGHSLLHFHISTHAMPVQNKHQNKENRARNWDENKKSRIL